MAKRKSRKRFKGGGNLITPDITNFFSAAMNMGTNLYNSATARLPTTSPFPTEGQYARIGGKSRKRKRKRR